MTSVHNQVREALGLINGAVVGWFLTPLFAGAIVFTDLALKILIDPLVYIFILSLQSSGIINAI